MHLQNIEWGYMAQKEEGVGDNHLVPAFKRQSQWYRLREKGSISRKSDSSCSAYSSLLIASVKSKMTVPEWALANAIWPTLSFLSILREVFKETKWKFLMEFPIERSPLPPLDGHNFHPFFYPTFFLRNLILLIWNGFYIWSQSKLSFISPLNIIGSKLTFSGWSDRCLPYSALFRVNSTSIYT